MGSYNSMVLLGVLKEEYVEEMTRLLNDRELDNIWSASSIPALKAFGDMHERSGILPNANDSYTSKEYDALIRGSGCQKIVGNVFYMAANLKNYDHEIEDFIDICKKLLCHQIEASIQGESRGPRTDIFTSGLPFYREKFYDVVDKDLYETYLSSRGRHEDAIDFNPWG